VHPTAPHRVLQTGSDREWARKLFTRESLGEVAKEHRLMRSDPEVSRLLFHASRNGGVRLRRVREVQAKQILLASSRHVETVRIVRLIREKPATLKDMPAFRRGVKLAAK